MENKIIVTSALGALLILSVWWFVYNINELKKSRKLLKRNKKLLPFRMSILMNHPGIYDKLPTYEEMLYSDKPLEDEYWLPKEYLDEKNRFGFE